MFKLIFAAAVAAAVSTTALAEGYRCELSGNGESFISSWFGIEIKPGASKATVYDAFIRQVHEKPIEVAVKDRGEARVRLLYTLHNVPTTRTPVSITYTVDLDTTEGTVSIRGRIMQASNMIIGKGKCLKGPISFN